MSYDTSLEILPLIPKTYTIEALEEEKVEPDLVQRVFWSYLPVIALYKPFALTASTIRATNYCAIEFNKTLLTFTRRNLRELPMQLLSLACGVAVLAGFVLNFQFGFVLAAGGDLIASTWNLSQNLIHGEFDKCLDDLLNIAANAATIAFAFTASFVFLCAYRGIQGVMALKSAHKEWNKGRLVEFLPKAIMGGARIEQCQQIYVKSIIMK